MTLPPPTASRKSTPSALHRAMPSRTLDSRGLGTTPAQLHIGHPGLIQRGLDPIQQSGALDAAAAVVEQHLFALLLPDQGAHLGLSPQSKDHLGGSVVSKSVHFNNSSIL